MPPAPLVGLSVLRFLRSAILLRKIVFVSQSRMLAVSEGPQHSRQAIAGQCATPLTKVPAKVPRPRSRNLVSDICSFHPVATMQVIERPSLPNVVPILLLLNCIFIQIVYPLHIYSFCSVKTSIPRNADSPKMVTLSGSPPKAAMLLRTHSSAAT